MNDHLIERIYDMHDKVVGKLVRKGIDRNEAPDLAVNILLDAVEAVDKLRDPEKLEAWVMVIAENNGNRYLRERAKHWEIEISSVTNIETGEEIDIYETMADEMTVEKILRHAERTSMLGELLGCLNDKERAIFFMHNLDEMTFREIAERLELNENTVRSIHSRCCRKLKSCAENLYGKTNYVKSSDFCKKSQ